MRASFARVTMTFFTTLLAATSSCGDDGDNTAPPASRVNAVLARPVQDKALDEFCDVRPSKSEAPVFALPQLASPKMPARPGFSTWLNVWATWCKPCVEELPLLRRWRERASRDGSRIDIQFLSVDADDADIQRFRAAHPQLIDSTMRVASQAALAAWLDHLGLSAGASIPIHVLIDAAGKTRCVRTGSIDSTHYEVARRLLSGI